MKASVVRREIGMIFCRGAKLFVAKYTVRFYEISADAVNQTERKEIPL